MSDTKRAAMPDAIFPAWRAGTVYVHNEKGYVGEMEKLTTYLATWRPGRRRTK